MPRAPRVRVKKRTHLADARNVERSQSTISNFPPVWRTGKRDVDNARYLVDGIVVVTNERCVHSAKIGAGGGLRDRGRVPKPS